MYGQTQGNPMQGQGPYQQGGGYGPQPFYGPESGYGPQPFYGPEQGYGPQQGYGPGSGPGRDWRDNLSPDQDIANIVQGVAGRFIGRAIGKRIQRVVEERVVPTLNARAEQSRQQLQQLQAIAESHPDLRACLRDQVIFLAGGTRTVPLSEVSPQITPPQADAIVARLREP